jgi:autotransporter-associated beta strand protein
VAPGQSFTFSGTLGDADPNFSFNKYGAGTQILATNATYTGGTSLYLGTLQIGVGGTTGALNPASPVFIGDAILAFNRSNTVTQGVDFANGVTGVGRLFQRGTGTLIVTSNNTYTGGTVIEAGRLQIGNGAAAGSLASNTSVTNSGTLAFKRTDDFSFSGVVTGSGGVVNDGNIVRFAYAQSYTGPTVLNTGTLVLTTGGDQGLSPSTVVTVAAGARLDFSNRALRVAGLNGGGQVYSFGGSAGALEVSSAAGETHSFAGNLGGNDPNFSVTKSEPGTQVLSGANTYTGTTRLNGGALRLAFGSVSTNILPSASALVLAGGSLLLSGTGTQAVNGVSTVAGAANNLVLGANETLTLGALGTVGAGSSLRFDTSAGGADAGTSTLGTSLVVLTGQTPGSVIAPGFTVVDAGGIGFATVNAANRVVRLTGATALLPPSGALSTAAYTVDNNAGGTSAPGSSSLTLASSASAGGILVITTAASGTLTLPAGVVLRTSVLNFSGTGANSYLISGGAGGAGVSAIAAGDQLTLNNYNSGTITFGSPILDNGTTAVVINGTGTTVLAGANNYAGGLTVNGGTLQLPAGAQAGPGRTGAAGNPATVGPGGPGGAAMMVNPGASLMIAPA